VSRRAIRAPAVAGLLAVAAAGVAAPAALACSCVPPSAATVSRAEVVFTGTVTAREDPNAGQPTYTTADPITHSMAVDQELKGEIDAAVRVVTARDGSSCGVDFEVGQRYLVVADRPVGGGDLRTDLCQGTQELPVGAPLPEFAQGLDPGRQPAGVTWPAPERVSRPGAGTDSPRLALGPGGVATALWQRTTYGEGRGGSVASSRLFAAGDVAGGGFGTPEIISSDDELALFGDVAAAGDTHVAVWLGFRAEASAAGIIARVRTPGGSWGAPQVLESADATVVGGPWVAGDGSGGALAVWRRGDDYRAAAFTPSGGWQAPVTAASDVPEQTASVALGSDGTAVVAWWVPDDDGDIRAAVRDPSGAWREPVTLSTPVPADDEFLARPPSVSVGASEALVVWAELDEASRGFVRAARVGPDGIHGIWRVAAASGAGDPAGGLDAAGRATVIWSTARRQEFHLRWAGQEPGGRWSAPRRIAAGGSPCAARLSPSLAVAPSGLVQAIWTEADERGEVVVAATRPAGAEFARPRVISRSGVSGGGVLAVADGGAAAAWARSVPGARTRQFIEATVRGFAQAGRPALRQLLAPRITGVRLPARISHRARLPVRVELSMAARLEIFVTRTRRGTRFVGPFRRAGRAGANELSIPSWGAPGRRLGPGVYEVRVQALTAERAGCPVTRRLVVRS
jgi:hypothetical protein